MAVMKPMVPVAGRRRAFLGRVGALACSLVGLGCGGPTSARAERDTWLDQLQGFSGARFTDKTDPNGFPLPGGNEAFLNFTYPVSAVGGADSIFIADAGLGRMFRYARGSGLMAVVPGVRVGRGTRLQSGIDGTVYLLDAYRGEISRYSPYGLPLPAFHSRVPTSRYLDFAVDAGSGRVFAVDATYRVVDRIEPLARIAQVHLDIEAAGPIALDGQDLFVADSSCKCVTQWRNGRFLRKLATGLIRLPTALATEAGELYVLDGFDRSISRVAEGGLETAMPATLNLVSPEHISVSGGIMYVADGVSRTVALFRIRHRKK